MVNITLHILLSDSLLYHLMPCMTEKKRSVSMMNRPSISVLDLMQMDGLEVNMASYFCGCQVL